jgi:ribosomal protein S18 acetylase RimI-like enzyme
MNDLDLLPQSPLTVRKMVPPDLSWMMNRTELAPQPRQMRYGFWQALKQGGIGGEVAAITRESVGFVLYQVNPPPERPSENTFLRVLRKCLPGDMKGPAGPRYVNLLHIAVLPERRRQGIGQALLEELAHEFGRPDDRIQTVVPETNLAVQLLLRAAGYRAICVWHGYFGDEDGYVMERRAG